MSCEPRSSWKQSGRRVGALPVGEEAEVADAYETAWQQVEQEAAQELVDSQSHDPLLVAVDRVAPTKCYVTRGESN
jgi:hypothetical protein